MRYAHLAHRAPARPVRRLLTPLLLLLLPVALVSCTLPDVPTPALPGDDPATRVPPTLPPTVAPLPAPVGDRVPARVVRVVDGDTIAVEIEGVRYTLRYIGVDTPETVHPERPVEPYGPEASAANKALVEGKIVYLEKDVSETDRFGRLLRYVYLADGTFVNAELIRQGYAQAVTFPPDVKHEGLFRSLQREAREAGRGLWGLEPATVEPAADSVVIAFVYYDGLVPVNESDEYAEIRNDSSEAVNLAGWRLNAGSAGQDFTFPGFVLAPGATCRVYTNEVHPVTCGFSFGSSQPLWSNRGECGYLFDAAGEQVSEYCYSGN